MINKFLSTEITAHYSIRTDLKKETLKRKTTVGNTIIWIVEDSGELTKAWLKYAVNKVFQNDRHQSCWVETLHQG